MTTPISSTDPKDLIVAAKCFESCIDQRLGQSIKTHLVDQIAVVVTNPVCVQPNAPILVGLARSDDPQFAGMLQASWKQTKNIGGFIKGYIVFWGTTAGGPYPFNSGVLPPIPRTYTITGLTPGTTYYVVVQAITALAGCNSANSNQMFNIPGGTPSGPCAAGTTLATTWANRVVVNGGAAPSAATKTAIANFQCGLITDGLDTLMIAWNAFVPDNLIAAITPQLLGGGNDPWTNSGFVAGALSVNGLAGDGTHFLNPGLLQTVFPSDTNMGISMYMPVGNTGSSNFENGVSDGALGTGCFLCQSDTINGRSAFSTGGAWFANAASLPALGLGFFSGSRTAANSINLYWGNSTNVFALKASSALAGTARVANAMNVMSINLVGVGNNFGPTIKTLSFIAFHQGLNLAQSTALFNRVTQLRTDLGGGFV